MRRCGQSGFTLVELTAAMTITVLIAAATATVLYSITSAKKRIDDHSTLAAEARAASRVIRTALRNAYRAPDQREAKLIGTNDWLDDLPADRQVRFGPAAGHARRKRSVTGASSVVTSFSCRIEPNVVRESLT